MMSIAFLLDNKNDAVVWRGPRKAAIIKQFLTDVNWGEVRGGGMGTVGYGRT